MKEPLVAPVDNFAYYDVIYGDKDYHSEAAYVSNRLRKYVPYAYEILELGSGTGNYSSCLSDLGFRITGIDCNPNVVARSREKEIENFNPIVADIRSFELDKTFDAVVSMFHVISYLTTNDELINCFSRVNEHLDTGGVFMFDVWHTPAVNAQGTQKRTKQIETDEIELTRVAIPTIYNEENIVDVNYQLTIRNKYSGKIEKISEHHYMRHFTGMEIDLIANLTGFTVLKSEELITKAPPGNDTWGVCYILQKHGKTSNGQQFPV